MATHQNLFSFTAAGIAACKAKGLLGNKMRRIKGARHAHATIRASGRVPGQEARAAQARYRAERKAAQTKDRSSSGQLDGI